eukprot:1152265-Pelagomonas_calceolata.AAC.5
MAVDSSPAPNSHLIASVSYDRTVKLWAPEGVEEEKHGDAMELKKCSHCLRGFSFLGSALTASEIFVCVLSCDMLCKAEHQGRFSSKQAI